MQFLGQQSSKSFWDVAKLRKYMNLSFSTDASCDGGVIIFSDYYRGPGKTEGTKSYIKQPFKLQLRFIITRLFPLYYRNVPDGMLSVSTSNKYIEYVVMIWTLWHRYNTDNQPVGLKEVQFDVQHCF